MNEIELYSTCSTLSLVDSGMLVNEAECYSSTLNLVDGVM